MVKKTALVVEDSLPLLMLYSSYLKAAGFEVRSVDTGSKCLAEIDAASPAVLILDLGLPDMSGLDILKSLRDRKLPIQVVITTTNGSLNTAVEAMRLGAFDYVVKPFTAERLSATARNAFETFALKNELTVYKSRIARDAFAGFIGGSLPMQAVYRIIESAATSKATVFITGESGTGKEVCANAVHAASARADLPFVAINCAAIPRELMESEIFGHVKGAFSGATADRVGAAGRAHKGTLFLDEICEMPLELQAKMLRLLQNGTYEPVGSSRTEHADLRVICATNRDPEEEVRCGRFRADLFYRLHVIPILLPPLRERGDDVLAIARSLVDSYAAEEGKQFKGLADNAATKLAAHSWPGNVRELQNVIRHAVVINDGALLDASMLPPLGSGIVAVRSADGAAAAQPRSAGAREAGAGGEANTPIRPLWEVERDTILDALAACQGNVTKAAALLEVGVSTLYRKKSEFEASRRIGAPAPSLMQPATALQ